jgi:hypothetical protein
MAQKELAAVQTQLFCGFGADTSARRLCRMGVEEIKSSYT